MTSVEEQHTTHCKDFFKIGQEIMPLSNANDVISKSLEVPAPVKYATTRGAVDQLAVASLPHWNL